jgi:hypothetical protein
MKKCAILFLLLTFSALGAELPFKSKVLENGILYVGTTTVTPDFASQMQQATPTNHLSGTILDLRFADGTAADATFPFAPNTPLIILINGQTRGAAATLAAQLRSSRRGIVIGSTNSASLVFPDIGVAVSTNDERKFQENPFARLSGVPSATPPGSNAFLPYIDHTSEADLVRKRVKDGDQDDSTSARTEPDQPVIRDPALARAVDLLKALAILKQSRG